MYELMVVIFVLGYLCITLEHQLKVDKAAVALVTGILCWTIYVVGKEQIVDLDKVKDHAIHEFSSTYPGEITETSDESVNDEITYEAYVSEQNLLSDDSDEPIKHPLINEIFSGKVGSSYFKPSN